MAKNSVYRSVTIVLLMVFILAPTFQSAEAVASTYPDRLSLSTAGVEGDGNSWKQSISGNGHLVAFESSATNLVSWDTNDSTDIFVRDTWEGVTSRISLSSAGVQANGASFSPVISYDGGFIIFSSTATNLVPGDTNGTGDVFVRSTFANTTTRISVASDGTQGNGNSGGYGSYAISTDGSLIVFASDANNLVDGDTNGKRDLFMYNTKNGVTTRISVSTAEDEGNGPLDSGVGGVSMSKDGRYVVFSSDFDNLIPSDTNDKSDIFLRDTLTNTTTRISVTSSEVQANGSSDSPCIAPNGGFVAFASDATNLATGDLNTGTDIFVRDLGVGTTELASVSTTGVKANGVSSFPVISSDGQYVAFQSAATNLVSGDTNAQSDIFIRYRPPVGSDKTARVSVPVDNTLGVQADGESYLPSITSEGTKGFVVFSSLATNLVDGDINLQTDVFQQETSKFFGARYTYVSGTVKDVDGNPIRGVTVSHDGSPANDFVTTDALGGYLFILLPGTYSLSAVANSTLYESCTSPDSVTLVVGTTQSDADITCLPYPPAAPELYLPTADETAAVWYPKFKWQDVPTTTSYTIKVSQPEGTEIFSQTFVRSAAICDGLTCSATANTPINNGQNFWSVQAKNGSGSSDWSESRSLNSSTRAVISPVLKAPSGSQLTSPSSYSWTGDTSATKYQLTVSKADGTVLLSQWYTAVQTKCLNATGCSYAPTLKLAAGSYKWSVKSYNPVSSVLSAVVIFSIDPAGIPLPRSPNTSILARTPKFSWTGNALATNYKLLVSKADGTVLLDQWYTSLQTQCKSAAGCSVAPTLNLLPGNYKWTVAAMNSLGYSWGATVTFSVDSAGIPLLISPKSSVISRTPTFSWTGNAKATNYRLAVSKADGKVLLDRWYTSAQTKCSNATACSYTPSLTLVQGSYKWTVSSYYSTGITLSATTTFNVDPAGIPLLIAPKNSVLSLTPTFSWTGNTKSTNYRLWVSKADGTVLINRWYTSVQTKCSNATACSFVSTLKLVPGRYKWAVMSYNKLGSSWSATVAFSVDPAGIPLLIAPKNSVLSRTPTFSWTGNAKATNYKLLISKADGTVLLNKWFTSAETKCLKAAGCSYTPTLNLVTGSYKWAVAAFNSLGSSWSATVTFSVDPAGIPLLIAPKGSVLSRTPTFTWTGNVKSTNYRVLVSKSDGTVLMDRWITDVQAKCLKATGCSYTPTLNLVTGSYKWAVKSYNKLGSSWSATVAFSVDPAGIPLLIAPKGVILSHTPTLTWTGNAKSTNYRVLVSKSDGTVLLDRWITSVQAKCSNATGCSYMPNLNLVAGSYKWAVKSYNKLGSSWSTTVGFNVQ